jgi:hypothetical protein
MRVNVYAEEMTDRVEIVTKTKNGQDFTGLRIYLELPVTVSPDHGGADRQVSGPFIHGEGDDDSSAVTFWGKRDLREVLKKALDVLERHYNAQPRGPAAFPLPEEPAGAVVLNPLPEGWSAGHTGVWTHTNGAMVMRVHSMRAHTLTDKNWVYACFRPGTMFKEKGTARAIAEVKDFAEALQVAQSGLPTGWRRHDERNWVHDNGAVVRWWESQSGGEPGYSAFGPGCHGNESKLQPAIATELVSLMQAMQIAERGPVR